MARYTKGANFERKVKEYFENKGFYVVRSAGSHGYFDLVALGKHDILLIQCKKGMNVNMDESLKEYLRNDFVCPDNTTIMYVTDIINGGLIHEIIRHKINAFITLDRLHC